MKFSLLFFLIIFSFGNVFSQTKDSVNVQPIQFNTSTTIHFELINSSIVSLTVLNRWGEIIKSFYQSELLSSGSYNEILAGDSIKNGLYYVLFKTDQNTNKVQTIVKNSTLGLSENSPKISNLTISPNPFSNLINIPIEGSKKIEIRDLAGKIVHSIVTEETTISLSKLVKGEYLISIYSKENQLITSQKIVKID